MSVKFRVFLQDDVSSPARNAAKSLDRLASQVDGLSKLPGRIGAAAVATGIGAIGYSFLSAGASALTFKENSLAAFKTLTGSAESAKAVMEEAQTLGKMTPFDTQDVVKNYQKLLGAGFKQAELNRVFQGLGDAASLATSEGDMRASLENMTRGIVQMKAKGVVQMEELRGQIMEASNGYLNQGMVFEQIAKQMRIPFEQVDEAIRAGSVSADVGVYAITAAIEKRSGKLGTVMEAQSKTITGMWSGIKSAAFDFFAAMDMKGEGYKNIQGFLSNLLKTFDPSSEAGQKLLGVLNKMLTGVGKLFGVFSGGDGLARMVSIFDGLASVLEWVFETIGYGIQAFQDFAPESKAFGSGATGVTNTMKAMGTVIQMAVVTIGRLVGIAAFAVSGLSALGEVDYGYILTQIAGGFGAALDWLKDFGKQLWNSAVEIGTNIVKGLVDGITYRFSQVKETMGELVGGLTGTFTTMLGIHSPSRVFEGYGENTVDGYTKGLGSGTPDASLAIMKLGEAQPVAQMAGARNSVSVTVNVSVDARGGGGDEIASRLSEILPGHLHSVFEQLAIEAGGY